MVQVDFSGSRILLSSKFILLISINPNDASFVSNQFTKRPVITSQSSRSATASPPVLRWPRQFGSWNPMKLT